MLHYVVHYDGGREKSLNEREQHEYKYKKMSCDDDNNNGLTGEQT